MMWSAVCSGSPHSHAALSASPHCFMDALYRPTPVRSLFRVIQCFRLISSPLTPSPRSDTWRCTRVGPDASHSCFHVAAIHASIDRSSWMILCISSPTSTTSSGRGRFLIGVVGSYRHRITATGPQRDDAVVISGYGSRAGRHQPPAEYSLGIR